MPRTMTIPPDFHCPYCDAPNKISLVAAEAYFRNVDFSCHACDQPINWWDASVKTIKDNFMYTQAFGFVDAQSTLFEFALPSEKTTVINFRDFGVPDEARILAVNYTPQGPLFPLQWHSNQLIENQSIWGGPEQPHEVHLWPASFRGEKAETKIGCMVIWVVSSPDDPMMSNLIEAFAAYAKARYIDTVIPANVAVEAMVTRVLDAYLSRFVSQANVHSFLTGNATYSSQLNVILPVLAHLNDCPVMPDTIRGRLNRLRSLRNDLVHRGRLEIDLGKNETAELLAAATLGVAYAQFFERSLNSHSKCNTGMLRSCDGNTV